MSEMDLAATYCKECGEMLTETQAVGFLCPECAADSQPQEPPDLIVIEQLPIIRERLQTLSRTIQQKIEHATSLACTPETVQTIKATRAALNKEFADLEKQRMDVKQAIMQPYQEFEDIYKTYVSNQYNKADETLKSRINVVTDGIIAERKKEVEEYFNEYTQALNIDFVKLEQTGAVFNLTNKPTKLKKQVAAFLDGVATDLLAIETHEHKADVLYEYKKCLDLAAAVTTVAQRKKAIDEQREKLVQAAERYKLEKQAEARVNKVAPLAPPSVVSASNVDAPEQRFTLKFAVTSTKPKLSELKKFLDEGGYSYTAL